MSEEFTLRDIDRQHPYDRAKAYRVSGDTICDTLNMLARLEAENRQLRLQAIPAPAEQTPTDKDSLTVAPAEPEREWAVTYSFLVGHPGDRRTLKTPAIFSTEKEADDCIAGKMDCSPQMMRESGDVRKLWRTKAGEWQDAALLPAERAEKETK